MIPSRSDVGGQFLHGATFYGTVYICERVGMNESSSKIYRSPLLDIENNFKII